MKYEVGDLVYLREDLALAEWYGGIEFLSKMSSLKKSPGTIIRYPIGVSQNYSVSCDETGLQWFISEEMIDHERSLQLKWSCQDQEDIEFDCDLY